MLAAFLLPRWTVQTGTFIITGSPTGQWGADHCASGATGRLVRSEVPALFQRTLMQKGSLRVDDQALVCAGFLDCALGTTEVGSGIRTS